MSNTDLNSTRKYILTIFGITHEHRHKQSRPSKLNEFLLVLVSEGNTEAPRGIYPALSSRETPCLLNQNFLLGPPFNGVSLVAQQWRIHLQCGRPGFDPWVEDPLEKGMATHSNILAWRIPWTEEPGGLQSMRSQRVGHDWAHTHNGALFINTSCQVQRRKQWPPLQYSCLENPMDGGAW